MLERPLKAGLKIKGTDAYVFFNTNLHTFGDIYKP